MNDWCAPSEGQPPGWKGCQPSGVYPANHKICAKLAFFKANLGTLPSLFGAIFPHKPTTTTDCYINMMFFKI